MRAEAFAALAAFLLAAGCVGSAASPTAPAGSPVATAAADDPRLVLGACEEMQARFAISPDDYPPEAFPPGFTLKPNPDGTANVVAIARACDRDGASSDTFLVFVEVSPPPELARDGSTHGFLLDLWADEPGTAALLRAWGFQTVEEREMAWDRPLLPQLPDHRMRSEDFLLTIHPVAAPTGVPHASVRVFEVVEAQVSAAFDTDRPEDIGAAGPATASFIVRPPQPGYVDLPYHQFGEGSLLQGGWGATYAPVGLGPA